MQELSSLRQLQKYPLELSVILRFVMIFAVLRDALSGHKPARLKGLPPFTAGAVGYLAYDAVRQIERLPTLAKDELQRPRRLPALLR